MIDESLGHLLSILERCATALEAIAGRVATAKEAARTPAEATRAAVDPPAAVPPSPASNGSGKPEVDAPVAYETLRLAVVELAKVKGHKLAMSMLEEFGVSTGKDIPPAQYSKALKRAKELLK